MNNQPCTTRATIIDLNPHKYNQRLCYYPFKVSLDRCNGSFNTLDDPSSKICVSNKANDVNLNVFDMTARTNQLKQYQNIFHANVNAILMAENATEIKNRITINVRAIAKAQ